MEQFEDDPLEFIRLDLSLSSAGTDLATRRQAAADVLQALVGSGFETEVTEIVGSWITTGLSEYNANPRENWKAKDSAVYLLTAVATRGSTTQVGLTAAVVWALLIIDFGQHGVTSTNALVDVVKFFSDHVFQDLQAEQGSVHPIMQVDAIRFLYTFRNQVRLDSHSFIQSINNSLTQLTKQQLLSVLPLLVRHLGSENYVTYTYAAITIDRILFIKQGMQLLCVISSLLIYSVLTGESYGLDSLRRISTISQWIY